MKFIVGAIKFFGKKPDQTTRGFIQEVKLLTPSDISDITPELEKALNVKIEAQK